MTKRRKFIFATTVVAIAALAVGAQFAGRNENQLKAGVAFPLTHLQNIYGMEVVLPNPQSHWVHLQFRRFAGCPICNLHLFKGAFRLS